MAKIPTSNIKISQIGNEFPREVTSLGEVLGDTAPHSLSEFYGVAGFLPEVSGEISFSDFSNKESIFTLTINSNTANLNVAAAASLAGWDGVLTIKVDIQNNIYVWSDSTLLPALTTGVIPRGLIIQNRGYIMGKGGDGAPSKGFPPGDGGTAISLGCDTVLINSGYIGGGGGAGSQSSTSENGGGGGAGGGRGGYADDAGAGGAGGFIGRRGSDGRWAKANKYRGAGGTAGGSGGSGESIDKASDYYGSGGGGGRIMPGFNVDAYHKGGFGGGPEQVGGDPRSSRGGWGGGGWGADGGGASGGSGGAAIVKNGNALIVTFGSSRIYGAY